MQEKIIKKETKQGEGIYLIEVDKEKSSKVEGNDYAERLNNAINEFLNEKDPNHPSNTIGFKLKGQ